VLPPFTPEPSLDLIQPPPSHNDDTKQGIFWSSAEREYQELAWYYHLPTVSVKAAAFEDMLRGKEGFEVERPRETDEQGLRGRAFYYDYIHPDGHTGHK